MEQTRIPIRNLYFLLCYSWDQLEQGELVDVSKCPSDNLVDLFALVLCSGINHLARRGLEQAYQPTTDELSSPRGRIEALQSARRFLQHHGRAACTYDELTVDTLNNRILKCTLQTLARCAELSSVLRDRINWALRSLRAIESIQVTAQDFRRVQLHGNTRFYRFLLNVCALVHESSLPDQKAGGVKFRDFVRDERAMARVFEQFLFNFLRRELGSAAKVKRDRIFWQAVSETDPELSLLPGMHTDISVYRGGCRLVIDAKYYRSSLSLYRESAKFHSANLYQLMSYLTNSADASVQRSEGMLIYPRVDRTLRERYRILGYPVTVATVDLSAQLGEIRAEILQLVATSTVGKAYGASAVGVANG